MRVVTVELSTSAGRRGGADTAAPACPAGTCLHRGWRGCPGCRRGAERPPTRAEPDEVPADEHGHVQRAVGRGIQCDVVGAQRLLQSRLPLPPAEGSQNSLGRGPEPRSPTTVLPQPGEPCHPASSCWESGGQTATRGPLGGLVHLQCWSQACALPLPWGPGDSCGCPRGGMPVRSPQPASPSRAAGALWTEDPAEGSGVSWGSHSPSVPFLDQLCITKK